MGCLDLAQLTAIGEGMVGLFSEASSCGSTISLWGLADTVGSMITGLPLPVLVGDLLVPPDNKPVANN